MTTADLLTRELAALMQEQACCFSRNQALACGLTDEGIDANIRARRWARPAPGVLVAFTGPMPYLTRVWAGVLAAGEGAAATRSTALRLFGLASMANDDSIQVVIDHDRRAVGLRSVVIRRRRGLASVMHPHRLPPSVRVEEAVLQHAARVARPGAGLAVIADSCQQGLTTASRLKEALELLPRLRKRRLWLSALEDVATGAHSFLELTYLRSVERAHGLPTPIRQAAGRGWGGARVWRDGEYPGFGVVLELDGRLGHEWASDQLRDRRRDATAAVYGSLTLRHGYADVMDPCETARLVAAVLHSRGWRGAPRRCSSTCTAAAGWHD
jgi:hypothetical protein